MIELKLQFGGLRFYGAERIELKVYGLGGKEIRQQLIDPQPLKRSGFAPVHQILLILIFISRVTSSIHASVGSLEINESANHPTAMEHHLYYNILC
ncbi:hypothetical protein B9Z55_002898 [Caenorhabditis nigoni]|uniref:Uncharacterized protein n=1 Tax=Caenorhabditis nigoni TaxID=1611254 RepID=A0A2G5VMM1_9PELO|nr:hypothetical protein B9Z55_002898 [Caenorhabditis nigoni]